MSWNDKLVSVILLVYNSAEQLPRALASVFAQDYPRLEIIVTDDGSEEFDAEEVSAYIEKHKTPNIEQFSVISSPVNTGTVANLRRALAVMHGDYYINFGADDAIYRNTVVSEYMETFYLRNWEPLMVCGRLGMYKEDLLHYIRSIPSAEEMRILSMEDPEATLNALASSCPILNVSACMRKDYAEIVDAYDPAYKLYEDYPTFLRMARKGYIPVFINRIMMKHAAGGVANGTKDPVLAETLYRDRQLMWEKEFAPYRSMFSKESIAANKRRRKIEKKQYQDTMVQADTENGAVATWKILYLFQILLQKLAGKKNKISMYLQTAALLAITFFTFWILDVTENGQILSVIGVLFGISSLLLFAGCGAVFVANLLTGGYRKKKR